MANMICKTEPAKTNKSADCYNGNRCCTGALHASSHKVKRRTLKRSERNQWKKAARQEMTSSY